MDKLRETLRAAAERVSRGLRPRRNTIFRTIHIVWVGDESKRPDNCIETWRRRNPRWTVKLWGNRELLSLEWNNHKHISQMLERKMLSSVADMMRWEILDKHGGFAIDADSICVRPLEDWLFEPHVFACWESEVLRPGLIANGYVYAHPANPLIQQIIDDIYALPNMDVGPPWKLTGPQRLTDTFRQMRYSGLTIYPSHYFIPTHCTGHKYTGAGPVFAEQFWGGTRDAYSAIVAADVRERRWYKEAERS